jgi:geranylgeranyl pyrophosphate synthase
VYALEKAEDGLRKELVNIYQNGALGKNGIAIVLGILEAVDVQRQAQKMVEKYCDEAMEVIDKLVLLPSARHSLKELVHFLAERNF